MKFQNSRKSNRCIAYIYREMKIGRFDFIASYIRLFLLQLNEKKYDDY
jgi:hypothetical protein